MSGIYALIDLGGAPLDPRDLAMLGFDASTGRNVAAVAIDGITLEAAHVHTDGVRTTVFLGHLDEPETVAARLGIVRTTPDAVLARVALDRYGAALPAELLGGWMMLDIAEAGTVTMLVGIGGRMPLLYARAGNRLAIAPSIHALSRLDWVARTLDEEAFLLSLTNCTLGDERRTQTILRGVRSVPRGGCVTIAQRGEPRLQLIDPFVAVPRWSGSRGEAMAAAEDLLRRIVRQELGRSHAPGLLLSGGLDSSLIAWALAAEGGTEGAAGRATPLPALSSAVEPGRGVTDETSFAAIVADTLGLSLRRVVPLVDVNVYRPNAATLAASNFPPLSPRDYVYAAFAETAASIGVTELFDGGHGELTFTALMPVWFWHDAPRLAARNVRNTLRDRTMLRDRLGAQLDLTVEVALARHRLDQARTLIAVAATEREERRSRYAGERWGYSAGARPPLRRDVTEMRAGQLRLIRPFHDIRLLRLFAGFPAKFMVGEGMTRWPARAILAGRLPDSIVRRRTGMPFSPDYDIRLVEQAPAALARIATFRASGCDEWFDLEWLREELCRFAAGTSADVDTMFKVQLTAHACEFLTWWRCG